MKIYGSGFLAKNLKKINVPNNFFIYAAGVSNSNLRDNKEFIREVKLFRKILKKIHPKKKFVYISSLSVENTSLKNDPYVKNKIKIENILKKECKDYLIIRLPQIVGKNKNVNTLTNSIYNCFLNDKTFKLWKNSKRNLIDIDDINYILEKYFKNFEKNKKIINIFNYKSVDVLRLLKVFSNLFDKKINIKIVKKNNRNINLNKIQKDTLLPKFYYNNLKKRNYILNMIAKYYL